MKLTKIQKILIVAIAVLIAGYFVFDKRNSNKNTKNNTATTTESNGITVGANGTGTYTINKISEETIKTPTIKIPDLSRPVKFLSSLNYDETTKKMITDKITSLQSSLKSDPSSFSKWVDLGMYQKMAGDYEGASISWKYITEMSSKDFISFGNLGDLYAYYIKDNGVAEMYYKKAINNAPKQIYLYTQLSDVYRLVFKDMDKAKAIIDEGLKKNPGDKALLEFKDNLYK